MVSGGWRGWRGARWGGAIAGLAAAAAVATFTLHGTRRAPDHAAPMTPAATTPPTSSGGRPTSPSTSTLAASTDAAALQPVQLVLHAATAHHVSVVGDFTEWDERRAAMTRDAESGLWSITLALRPGRHVYAFLVDDSIWVRDPRAPVAADADFGRPGSVLLVGRP